jgi:hypothetical protein
VSNAEYCGLNQSVTLGMRLSYVNVRKYEEAEAALQKSRLRTMSGHIEVASSDFAVIVNEDRQSRTF